MVFQNRYKRSSSSSSFTFSRAQPFTSPLNPARLPNKNVITDSAGIRNKKSNEVLALPLPWRSWKSLFICSQQLMAGHINPHFCYRQPFFIPCGVPQHYTFVLQALKKLVHCTKFLGTVTVSQRLHYALLQCTTILNIFYRRWYTLARWYWRNQHFSTRSLLHHFTQAWISTADCGCVLPIQCVFHNWYRSRKHRPIFLAHPQLLHCIASLLPDFLSSKLIGKSSETSFLQYFRFAFLTIKEYLTYTQRVFSTSLSVIGPAQFGLCQEGKQLLARVYQYTLLRLHTNHNPFHIHNRLFHCFHRYLVL